MQTSCLFMQTTTNEDFKETKVGVAAAGFFSDSQEAGHAQSRFKFGAGSGMHGVTPRPLAVAIHWQWSFPSPHSVDEGVAT